MKAHCLILLALTLGQAVTQATAQAPKATLEIYLPGQAVPQPPPVSQVLAWGDNSYGQSTVPASAQSGVVAIAAGSGHTVALKQDGRVLAWGNNSSGQSTLPAAAQSGVVAIAAGGNHTVALKQDGSVIAWGANYYDESTVPAAAQSGVVAIAAGAYHTVALKQDGSVVAWGVERLEPDQRACGRERRGGHCGGYGAHGGDCRSITSRLSCYPARTGQYVGADTI